MVDRRTVLITGASSGLGKCLASEMEQDFWHVINWSKETGVDVSDAESVKAAASFLKLQFSKIDVLVNCAGVNRIEYIPNAKEEDWDLVMNTNAKGIFLTAKYLSGLLRNGTICNIVSNAALKPMTSSIAYNASKGAALIMTRQMSRELRKTHGITIFSVSPNKLKDTGMSEYIDNRVCELRGWSPEEARNYQLAGLEAGEETDPKVLAQFIAYLLSSKERHKFLAGCDMQYGL